MSDARYDPLQELHAGHAVHGDAAILVVPPSFPARTVQEMVDHARANPGKLTTVHGERSAGHLAIEQFRGFFGLENVACALKGGGSRGYCGVAAGKSRC